MTASALPSSRWSPAGLPSIFTRLVVNFSSLPLSLITPTSFLSSLPFMYLHLHPCSFRPFLSFCVVPLITVFNFLLLVLLRPVLFSSVAYSVFIFFLSFLSLFIFIILAFIFIFFLSTFLFLPVSSSTACFPPSSAYSFALSFYLILFFCLVF